MESKDSRKSNIRYWAKALVLKPRDLGLNTDSAPLLFVLPWSIHFISQPQCLPIFNLGFRLDDPELPSNLKPLIF